MFFFFAESLVAEPDRSRAINRTLIVLLSLLSSGQVRSGQVRSGQVMPYVMN